MDKWSRIDKKHQLNGGPIKKKKKRTKMGGKPHIKGVVLKVSSKQQRFVHIALSRMFLILGIENVTLHVRCH